MNSEIEAIFMDVGNTIRVLVKDEPYQAQMRAQLTALVGSKETPDAFCAQVEERYKVYRKWAFKTQLEATEAELWSHWLLPEYPAERIVSLSSKLGYVFRQTRGRLTVPPESKNTVIELSKRNYHLGIISNIITVREIPDWLEADGLAQYFPTVVLSSEFGRRKPDPAIYLEAARRAGVEPKRSVYVGDNLNRDVEGTRLAGYGMAIILVEPATIAKEPPTGENKPDVLIYKLSELLDLFPPRKK